MRVAVVEDTQAIADMLRLVLEVEGVEVVTHTNNFPALLADEPWSGVDVAVVDLMLPGMDGETIVRYLADRHPSVRRVVLSAVAHQREGLDELATCITKPVDTRLLLFALGVHRD